MTGNYWVIDSRQIISILNQPARNIDTSKILAINMFNKKIVVEGFIQLTGAF